MRLSDAGKMRRADGEAIHDRGIASTLLMERAALGILAAVHSISGKYLGLGKTAAVFAGPGNNGGDGTAVAGLLLERGWHVRVFLAGDREKLTPDHREMERRLIEYGGILEDYSPEDAEQRAFVMDADIIIDALFGIGLNSPLREPAASAVELINKSPARVISADIASGVQADTGRILGQAVKADVTVTFSMAKPGHFSEPGCTCCGRLVVHDIGIPQDILEKSGTDVFALCDGEVTLPRRDPISHKGDYGKLLLIGGAVGYTGAPSICAKAAVRSGAGLVYLGVSEKIYPITAVKNDEAMPFPLPCTDDGILSPDAVPAVLERLTACDVCAAGPGLGRGEGTGALTRALLLESDKPLVLDADALPMDLSLLKTARRPVVLTPHEGEFVRIGGVLTGDRIGDARAFAREHGCVLVLKGYRTVCAYPDGEVYISTHGNPGMAKGGSGDALTGIIAALLGQLDGVKRAVNTAVFLHGLAGDIACEEKGEYAMTASDLIDALGKATRRLIR